MKLMRIIPLHSYYIKFEPIYKLKISKNMLTPCRGTVKDTGSYNTSASFP